MAQQGEEAGDGEGLVAVAQDLEVDGVHVEVEREVGNGGIDGDHEEDADDTTVIILGFRRDWGGVGSWGEMAYWRCSHGFK